MEARRFDRFAKAISRPASRRAVIAALGVALAGPWRGVLGAAEATSRRRECPTGFTKCRGRCVDTETDRNNCGRCRTRCPSGMSCRHGRCVVVCATDAGSGVCGDIASCAPACGCYTDPFDLDGDVPDKFCLGNPADPPGCESLPVSLCMSHADCPPGYLCTASSCCGSDAVCLPICQPPAAA